MKGWLERRQGLPSAVAGNTPLSIFILFLFNLEASAVSVSSSEPVVDTWLLFILGSRRRLRRIAFNIWFPLSGASFVRFPLYVHSPFANRVMTSRRRASACFPFVAESRGTTVLLCTNLCTNNRLQDVGCQLCTSSPPLPSPPFPIGLVSGRFLESWRT